MAMRWYVVHVYSGFENKVAQSIREQAEQKGLVEKFEEISVPTEEVVEMRRGQKVQAERKFFPGYVLVKMELTDETWHLVKNTAKVTGFLGSRGKPMPITEAEAQRILQQVQEGIERPKPSITFEVGEQVRGRRRPVHLVQRLCRGGRRGAGAAQGRRLHLRPRDAGGTGIQPGREDLSRSIAPSGPSGPSAFHAGGRPRQDHRGAVEPQIPTPVPR